MRSNIKLQQVKHYCYLGGTVMEDNFCTVDIKRRIYLGKQAFKKKKKNRNVLTNKHYSIKARKALEKPFIWSVIVYGYESWTLKKTKIIQKLSKCGFGGRQ